MQAIYRSKDHSGVIERLTRKDPITDVALFPTIKALQCFAAMLGFEQNRRESFSRSSTDNIEWHTFDTKEHTRYIYLVALAATGDFNILKDQQDSTPPSENMIRIFEEYAEGGFQILTRWVYKNPSDPVQALFEGMERAEFLPQEAPDFGGVTF